MDWEVLDKENTELEVRLGNVYEFRKETIYYSCLLFMVDSACLFDNKFNSVYILLDERIYCFFTHTNSS